MGKKKRENKKFTLQAKAYLKQKKLREWVYESESDNETTDDATPPTATVQNNKVGVEQKLEADLMSEVSVKQEDVVDVIDVTAYPIAKQEYKDIEGKSTATKESNHYTVIDTCKEEVSCDQDGDNFGTNTATHSMNTKTEAPNLDTNPKRSSLGTNLETPPRKKRRCSEKNIQYNPKPLKIPKIWKSIGKPIQPKDRNPANLREAFYESCQVCFNDHSEESCPLKYYANVIDNNNSFTAGYCMPSQVMLGTSKVHSDRPSLFARDEIAAFTKLGPLKGKLLTKEELKTIKRSEIDIEHFWPLHAAKENPTYIDSYINTTNPAESNWLRFLLPAPYVPTYSTFNMQRVVIENEIYFITTNDIKAGDELFMHAMEPPERMFFNMRAIGTDEKAIANCVVCKLNRKRGDTSLAYYKHKGSFISPLYYLRHYRMEHFNYAGSIPYTKLFFCSVCNIELDDGTLRKKHFEDMHLVQKTNKKTNSSICSICRESFINKTALDLHRVAFHPSEGEGPKQCPECDQILADSVRLHHHRRANHTLKWQSEEATCEICSKTLRNKRQLFGHIKKVHSKANAKICHECGRSFHDGYQLRVHSLTHSGLKPYQCDLQSVKEEGMCTYACTTKQWMQKHYKSTHGLNDDNMPKIERKFQF